MSVVLNQAALHLLLESDQGPVAREVQQRADEVVTLARQNVRFIMARSPLDISLDVDSQRQADGSVVIGIRDSGRQARYLAEKETRERVWLVSALQRVFSRGA